jgi:hypothetical protein
MAAAEISEEDLATRGHNVVELVPPLPRVELSLRSFSL